MAPGAIPLDRFERLEAQVFHLTDRAAEDRTTMATVVHDVSEIKGDVKAFRETARFWGRVAAGLLSAGLVAMATIFVTLIVSRR